MPRPIQFHISGVIHSEHDAPLSNVTVQVLYKDLRSEKLLIATQTDAQGKYENFFNPTLVHVSESRPVDIFLKVFSGRTLLGTSPVLYNVGPKIDYDFKIGGGAYTGKSEYERILEKVAPIALANQVELGELVENEEHQDISFLAGETGETAEDITFLNLAHRLTKEQGNIAPDIYYACAKAGMPTNLRNLLLTKADAIQNAIEGGIDKNTISSKWRPEIKKVVGRFNSLASKQVLIGDDKQSVLFRKTLGSVLTEAEQNVFADTLFNHEQEEPAKFWENLKLKPGFTDGKAIEKAKKLLALNTLTSGQPELTNHLFKLQGNDPDLAEASGFAKFSEEDWQEHIRKAAVIDFPDWVTGDSVEEQTQFYAAALENRNKQLYPTPFFASRLKKDTQSTFAHQRDIQQFLLKNPEFDLKTTHFQKAFNQAALEGISDRNGLETELKTVVRLSKLADDYEKVSALQRKGISSATDAVHKFGEAQFEKEFAGQLGGATNASKIYRRAVSVHNKTSLIKVGDQARNNLKMYALGGNLISGGDLCECEECQSVLSPAAYFVDVLAFIRNADKDQATYDKLIERRPDLPYILLTCKNTNSPLPYIDLVNELLEKEVLKKLDPDRLMKNSYQSEGSAAELVALPEHVNPAAYEPLKGISGDTVFSQALPLDLSLEEVRVYSEKLGWQRYQLMEVFSGNQLSAKWNDPALARELLGFSGAELDIISGRTPFSLPEMDQAETTIQSLLTLTGLSYVELLQLLGTYFLNPKTNTGRMKIFQKVAGDNENVLTCNLNELFISGFNNAWLHKLTRFVRLWKGIKWDLYDLDQVLTTLLDNPAFPETAQFETKILLPLARVETISRQLHLTHSQTITLIAPISTALYLDHTKAAQPEIPSLYTQLFRNRLVSELEGSPFTENPDQLTGLLWSHKDPIGAALNVSVGDIAVLEQSGEVLSLASLSRVYREVLLSKTLRISLANLQLIQTAFGLRAADTGWDAADLIDFLEHYEIFKSTRVPIQKLLETLGSKVGEDYRLPLDDTFISSIIDFSNRLTPPEGEEAEDKDSIIREIIAFFTNNATLKSALAGPLTNPDDLSIKKTITAFIDPTESEILFKLPASQIAAQLRSLSDFVDAYLLCKVTPMLLKDWGFDMAEIKWMHDNRNRLGIAALWNEIPALNPEVYHAWISLFHLSKLNKERTDKTVSLISLLNTALSENTGAKAAYFTQFVKIFAIREESLELLAGTKNDFDDKGQLWLSFPDDFLRVKPLLDLLESNKTLVSLGASATQVAALLNPEPGPSDAKSVRNLLKTKYTNDQWLDIIKPISNRLRRRRKNALVKFLINKDDRWTSADDLYHHLLIDTEMETCMMTSRLKQAIGSVQLFIHRCLMNLEVGITLSSEFEKEWHEWRKAYRVWEANRKIFLYPENWIEPDLRDNKSPFFLELESQLKQSEVTEETAKDALQSYLEKLDKVSNLEMVGLFDDQEMGILHVLGRTQTLPHQYYYRTQQNGEWSAWTKVDLDINSDHIIMVVWNSRLLILWGEFTEKQGKGGSTSISNPADGPMTMSSTEAPTYFEMKLPWSEYKKGKWGGKKISKEVAVLDNTYGKANWSLSSRLLNGNLLIRIVETRPPAKEKKIGPVIYTQLFLGTFEFDSCNGSPKLKPTTTNGLLPEKLRMIKDVVPDGIWMKETILKDSFSLMNSGVAKSLLFKTKFTENELFESTPGQFRLLPNHHQIEAQKTISFFFNNEKNTFFARSSDRLLPLLSVDDNVPHILARETNHSTLNPAENETSPAQHYIKKEYTFQTFYHPHACELIRKLNVEGVDALYAHQETDQEKELFTADRYNPTNFVLKPYPVETLDFKFGGAYSLYNWELFYHAPLLIATRLAQNQRFLEALKWYHYIFNPTQSAGSGTDGEQFWITKPFKQEIRNGIQPIEELLLDEHFVDELNRQIEYWEHNPFNPHAVARTRQFAYMLRVVTLYIDNLIQWGDQLFQRDTIESINEATLLYTLASNILGKRKERVPARAVVSEKSFSDIFEKLDPFHNSLAELEIYINPSGDGPNTGRMLMPVFGIPGNDLVLKYWDTVADRLFKIRNCMNLQGEVRQLPLFEPPIDPALLVKGRAAGLDLNSILNDMNISLPNYRFQVMLQKANELCNDVKMLGGSLLAALEKKDAEELSLLRSTHELNMLELIKDVKEKQRDEAQENLNGLFELKQNTSLRKNYYTTRELMNPSERQYYDSLTTGLALQTIQSGFDMLANIAYMAPDVKVGAPTSAGVTFGGSNVGNALKAFSSFLNIQSIQNNILGSMASTLGGFQRRMDDWKFQAKTAELELKQIDKQIVAAEIRLSIADKDLQNHAQQMEQSAEVDDYMRSKFTNLELYDWMKGKISEVYFQSYQLAYSTARKAEKCMQHELGLESTNYIQYGYWDSLKKGLMSGEQLQFALRTLENEYLTQNNRKYEITKHISLSMLDPLALIKFRTMGICEFEVPEVLFDMDHPGNYFTLIQSVSLSIPCVAGPYTSVSAHLSLLNSKFRKSTSIDGGYAEINPETKEDKRFVYNHGTAVKSIATSSAQGDSGVFELNFRDERYLPFEGAGAISKWQLELPTEIRQFDYNSIADVIIHMSYSAKDGGADFKSAVNLFLKEQFGKVHNELGETELNVGINLKNEYANEWRLLKKTGRIELEISKSRLPYLVQSFEVIVARVTFAAKLFAHTAPDFTITVGGNNSSTTSLREDGTLGLFTGETENISFDTRFELSLPEENLNKLEELVLLVGYTIKRE